MSLGIDVGTSAVIARPHSLWSEQAPEDWWRTTDGAVGALGADLLPKPRSGSQEFLENLVNPFA